MRNVEVGNVNAQKLVQSEISTQPKRESEGGKEGWGGKTQSGEVGLRLMSITRGWMVGRGCEVGGKRKNSKGMKNGDCEPYDERFFLSIHSSIRARVGVL